MLFRSNYRANPALYSGFQHFLKLICRIWIIMWTSQYKRFDKGIRRKISKRCKKVGKGHREIPCQAGFEQSNPLLVRPIPLCSLTAVRYSAFSALPFLIRFDRHRNCKNLIINLHKSFRALILFGVALQLFLDRKSVV